MGLERIRNEIDGHINALKVELSQKMSESDTSAFLDKLLELKTKRNELAAISQLADELLCRVFIEVKPDPDDWSYRHQTMSWTGVTHVCRHWRDVGLNHPELWSEIRDGISEAWIETIVNRSKSAPVSLSWRGLVSGHIEDLLKGVLSKPHRFRRIDLQGRPDALKERLKGFRSASAPLLHHLILCNSEDSQDSMALPDDFLSEGAPRLQALGLYDCKLSWNSPLFEGLTSLKFYSQQRTPSLLPEQLLEVLMKMPGLMNLELSMAFPRMELLSSEESPLKLAHLQSLTLKGTPNGCNGLLRHLSIPLSTSIEVHWSYEDDVGISQLGPVFENLYIPNPGSTSEPSRHYPLIQSFRISRAVRGVTLTMWSEKIDFRFSDWRRMPFSISIYIWDLSAAGTSNILFSLPLENVRSFDFVVPFGNDEDLAAALSQLPSLEDIYVIPNTDRSFIEYLKRDQTAANMSLLARMATASNYSHAFEAPPLDLRLPQLKYISFYKTELFDSGSPHTHQPRDTYIPMMDVTDVVDFRAKAGVPVDKIRFTECFGVSGNGLDRLRRSGAEVILD